jgi:hypothetical protein
MGTFSDLQNSIADDLTRPDLLGSPIKKAILDAVKQYERSRFWFNVTRSKTFPTVVNQAAYTGTDLAEIPNIIKLDHLFILRSVNDSVRLRHFEADVFERLFSLGSTSKGTPTSYTYVDGQILLYPTPIAVYTIRPHMHFRFPVLNADGDSNPWTNEAENLIRAQAKLIMYSGNPLEDDDGAERMLRQLPGIKAMLDYETSARTATGRIRSSEPC